MDELKVLLPIPEAMSLLGISRGTIYKLLGSGELESVLIGKRRFVTRKQLARFVTNLEANPHKIT